jgi:hypothetical protein
MMNIGTFEIKSTAATPAICIRYIAVSLSSGGTDYPH